MGDNERRRDAWDKADIVGKWLIPVTVLAATLIINIGLSERAARLKTFEVAVAILQSAEGEKTPAMREWALHVFKETTGAADAQLTAKAVNELRSGEAIPSPSRELASLQPRVRIVRLVGGSADPQSRVENALRAAGYNVASVEDRPSADFPSQAEVRFYYRSDEAAASALQKYLSTAAGFAARLNDRTAAGDAPHRKGDLHIYIR